MTEARHTADTITDDALDALYARAEQLQDLLGVAEQTSNRAGAERVRAELRVEQAKERLRLAHQARRAKEHQLDDIRRALCDAGMMRDDDPYSHADLADVIRQTAPAPAATEATQHAEEQ